MTSVFGKIPNSVFVQWDLVAFWPWSAVSPGKRDKNVSLVWPSPIQKPSPHIQMFVKRTLSRRHRTAGACSEPSDSRLRHSQNSRAHLDFRSDRRLDVVGEKQKKG